MTNKHILRGLVASTVGSNRQAIVMLITMITLIIFPTVGSMTLHHWQRIERPGVCIYQYSSHQFNAWINSSIVPHTVGSMTLHHWQRLATPHMGGLLEDRPGVQIKGDRNIILDENDELYDLSDYEEEG